MEKNCTNCTYNIPVEGTSYYSGCCTDTVQCGNITSKDTVCSRYNAKELPERPLKTTIDHVQETIEALKCCTENGGSCETCPFARYECTCQQDLKFAALQLLYKQKSYIEALEYFTGKYGFILERNNHDGEIEYSCNGYVIDKDTAKVLAQAKRLIDWWE